MNLLCTCHHIVSFIFMFFFLFFVLVKSTLIDFFHVSSFKYMLCFYSFFLSNFCVIVNIIILYIYSYTLITRFINNSFFDFLLFIFFLFFSVFFVFSQYRILIHVKVYVLLPSLLTSLLCHSGAMKMIQNNTIIKQASWLAIVSMCYI